MTLLDFNKCPYCGSEEFFWLSDEMRDYDDANETAINRLYHCNHCGCDTLIIEPLKDERETDYKEFWESVK